MFRKEGVSVEYKKASNGNFPVAAWETISAFANTDGGELILGIKENTKDRSLDVTGVVDSESMIRNILNTQKSGKLSSPCITPDNIKIEEFDGKEVMTIFIPKMSNRERPVHLDRDIHNSYIRENESDRKIQDAELRFFIRESGEPVESELLDNVTMEDFSAATINAYKSILLDKGDELGEVSDNNEFLEKSALKVIDRSSSDRTKKFTKAALLLFGTNEAIKFYFPNFFLDFVVQDSPFDTEYEDRVYTGSMDDSPENIFSFYQSVQPKIFNIIKNSSKLDENMNREDLGALLRRALREALVNTLVHADYSSESPIKIVATRDYIQFKNPGDMRVSVNQFFIGGDSQPRNPKIFDAFMRAKLGEHTGKGGVRIITASEKANYVLPEVKSEPTNTEMILWTIHPTEMILDNLPEKWKSTYKYMAENLSAKYSDLEHLYKNSSAGHAILKEMTEAGVIERHGRQRGTRYRIPQDDPNITKNMNKLITQMQHSLYGE